MVTLASILNPEPPRSPLPSSRPTPDSPISPSATLTDEASSAADPINTSIMARDPKSSARLRAKGVVNFHPFEHGLSEASVAEIRRFQVNHFGSIYQNCRRIPYNSGKKSFSQKTGRDCFEVFQYDFKLPGEDDTRWAVMWDYQIGLVRVTPFFKCLKYPKTMPAKMINQNPGLKDITHSITGGSIPAQGYWMPFDCAKAVCATFCYDIAGALIPVFGPDFPSICIPRDMPAFGRFTISPDIIEKSTRQAEIFRCMYTPYGIPPSPRRTGSVSPRRPMFELHRGAEHSLDERRHGRFNSGLSVNTTYGGHFGEGPVAMSPGETQVWSRGTPRSYHAGIDPAMTTPRSATLPSPDWPTVNSQSMAHYHHAHHGYPHHDDISSGPGQLHSKLSQILTNTSPPGPYGGSGQHSPIYPRLASLVHHPGPPSGSRQQRNQPGQSDYGYTNGYAEHSQSQGVPATSWPAGTRPPSSNIGPTIASNRHAAENDAAMVLMHLRLPEPSQQRELAVDRNRPSSSSNVKRDDFVDCISPPSPTRHVGFAPYPPSTAEAPRGVKRRRATLV